MVMLPILLALQGAAPPSRPLPVTPAVAFVDVHVLPMDTERVLRHQTVVVRHGRVTAIGPAASTTVPLGAQVVRGEGRRWLMPGLADMHVHTFEPNEFVLFLAHGITTVRNLHGIAAHLAWRDSITRGLMIGPRIVTAGAILDGDPPSRPTNLVVRTAAEAESAVVRQQRAGFDLIKVYDNPSAEVLAAIQATARRLGLRVIGHVPNGPGLAASLSGGYHEVVHFEEVGQNLARAGLDWDSVAATLARRQIWINPTVRVFAGLRDLSAPGGVDRFRASEPWRFASAQVRGWFQWDQVLQQARDNAAWHAGQQRALDTWRIRFVPALRRHGVKVLAGSDSPMPGLVAAFALHQELEALVEVGFTPFEALSAATRSAGEWLTPWMRVGTVATGMEADLVLLDGNPLDAIGNVRHVAGTMVRGQWMPRAVLDSRLAEIAAEVAAARR